MRLTIGLAATMALVLGGAAVSGTPAHGVVVSDAWSRPTPKGLPTGVVYLTLANHGAAAERLIGGATPVATRMELHRSSMRNGVMAMDPVPNGLDLPAGSAVQIAPGGYHFMLVGLKAGLAAGSRFPATLTFAHAPPVRIEVQVRAGPPAMAGMAMH